MRITTGLRKVGSWLLTDDEVAAMRHWISDCPWADLDEDDIAELTREEVVAGVATHYAGGVRAFLDSLEV